MLCADLSSKTNGDTLTTGRPGRGGRVAMRHTNRGAKLVERGAPFWQVCPLDTYTATRTYNNARTRRLLVCSLRAPARSYRLILHHAPALDRCRASAESSHTFSAWTLPSPRAASVPSARGATRARADRGAAGWAEGGGELRVGCLRRPRTVDEMPEVSLAKMRSMLLVKRRQPPRMVSHPINFCRGARGAVRLAFPISAPTIGRVGVAKRA